MAKLEARRAARLSGAAYAGMFVFGIDNGEAAAEFQKILDHRAIVVGDPIGARCWAMT